MKRSFTFVALLSVLVSPLVAHAATSQGETTKLEFSTSAQVHGTPTHLTIRLSAHAVNESASQAQAVLNREVDAAVKMASGHDGITVHSGAYSIFQEHRDHAPARWNASQDVTLESSDSVAALKIAGQLQQQGLTLDSLDWSLDPQTRETLLQQARREALQKVTGEARADAEALGLHVVGLEHVSVSAVTPGPRQMMMMSERMASAPVAPQSSPEDQILRVTVFAEARLAP